MDISIYYDPMIAKLVAHGETRNEAIAHMLRAINDYKISGVKTTLDFCAFVLRHEKFVSGNFDTHFIQHHFKPEFLDKTKEDEVLVAAAFANFFLDDQQNKVSALPDLSSPTGTNSTWKKNRTRLR